MRSARIFARAGAWAPPGAWKFIFTLSDALSIWLTPPTPESLAKITSVKDARLRLRFIGDGTSDELAGSCDGMIEAQQHLHRDRGGVMRERSGERIMSSTGPDGQAFTMSLVLCTLGRRPAQLERLLDSLESQPFRSFEIILVDQNPQANLDQIVRSRAARLTLRHVRSDRGLSLARNVGLRHATGDIIGFPDDDCWYLADTLMQVAEFFRREGEVDILLGRTIDQFGRPSLSPVRKESGAVTKRNVWASGNSNTLFVRRRAIPHDGGFDEEIGVGAPTRFQSGEETDFVLGLMKNEARALYSCDLKVCHEQVEDVGVISTLRRAWSYSQGFGYVLKKHNFGRTYLAYRLARSLGRAGLAAIELQPVYGLSRLVWGVGTLVGYVTAAPKG